MLFDPSDVPYWLRWPGLLYRWWGCYQSRLRVWRGLTKDSQNFRPPSWCKDIACPMRARLSCIPHHSGGNVVGRIRWIVWYGCNCGFVDYIALMIIILFFLICVCLYVFIAGSTVLGSLLNLTLILFWYLLICVLVFHSVPRITSKSSCHMTSRFTIVATRSLRSLIFYLVFLSGWLFYSTLAPSLQQDKRRPIFTVQVFHFDRGELDWLNTLNGAEGKFLESGGSEGFCARY